jgi:hypothetical protein
LIPACAGKRTDSCSSSRSSRALQDATALPRGTR